MKKHSFFYKLMAMVVGVCILLSVLSATIFYFLGMQVFGNEIRRELTPRVRQMTHLTKRYLDGKLPYDIFSALFSEGLSSESAVYVFDDQGNLVICSAPSKSDLNSGLNTCRPYVEQILTSGEDVSETNLLKIRGAVVGMPVLDNLERVQGAVICIKPVRQLIDGMNSFLIVLLLITLSVMAILLAVSFYLSRRITEPISEMVDAANRMSAGDYTVKVHTDEDAGPELGALGTALNGLSGQLEDTIGKLTDARNRLNTVLNGVGDGILALDPSAAAITYANPAASELMDLSAFPPEKGTDSGEEFARCVQEVTEGAAAAEMSLERQGRILLVTLYGNRAEAESDGDRFIVLVRDVTEAERLEQTRRDYVANVSHELKTPIASIRSLAETLNDGIVKDEEGRARYYSHILRESTRLSRLIDDLLELSRLQSRSVALVRSEFQLDELLESVCDRMRITADYSGISLAYGGCPHIPVTSNRDRIEQVTLSLIDNAIKYCTDNGSVDVRAEDCGSYLKVNVTNSGSVSEEDLPHLFERFYKADKSHTGSGTGLGLAISKEILTMLGESIGVSSADGEVVFSFTVHKN